MYRAFAFTTRTRHSKKLVCTFLRNGRKVASEGTSYLVRHRRKRAFSKRRKVKSLRPGRPSTHRRTVNPWLIGRNGESLPPGCQMKAYALVPALEGRVARMAKLTDTPDLGFRNRQFQSIPLRFHRSPIYGRKTRFFNYQSRVDGSFDRAVWNRCVSCNCICD